MLLLYSIFILLLNTNIPKTEVSGYLEKLEFQEALQRKYILIVPLNVDYYVDNHWIHQFVNLPNRYPEVSFIFVEKDKNLGEKLIQNKRIQYVFDTKNHFQETEFFNGMAVLLEKSGNTYQITYLSISNAYQKKVEFYKRIKK